MQSLMLAGVVVRYEDHDLIPAKVWTDLLLWKQGEIDRSQES